MNGAVLTVAGNLTGDPELRYTASGAAVVAFTVASTKRIYDKVTSTWKDGGTTFLRCSAWRDQAENVAASLKKGDRVVVTGEVVQREYETKDGEKRMVTEVQVDEVSASLLYATVSAKKATRAALAAVGS